MTFTTIESDWILREITVTSTSVIYTNTIILTRFKLSQGVLAILDAGGIKLDEEGRPQNREKIQSNKH